MGSFEKEICDNMLHVKFYFDHSSHLAFGILHICPYVHIIYEFMVMTSMSTHLLFVYG